jgi:two-component system sensor histidine kinase CpxA
MRLRTKILFCAAANLVLLGLAVAVFVRLQFRPGVESILLAPGEVRVRELADQIAADLSKTEGVDWDALLVRYARDRGVELGLMLSPTEIMAGTIRNVPIEVQRGLPGFPGLIVEAPHEQRLGRVIATNFTAIPIGLVAMLGSPDRSVFFSTQANPRGYWFRSGISVRWPGSDSASRGTLLVRSSSIFFKPLLFDSRPWLACLAAITGITLLCWIPLIRGLTRSVQKITGAAGQIAEGHFDVQTGIRRRDEIGQLNDAIQRMAAQLRGFVTGQRRFLGDIAHELCAPIARTRVALGVLEERAEPAHKQYVETVHEEVEHMSCLVNELLQFSKAALASPEAACETIPIASLASRVIEREAGLDGQVRLIAGGELKVLAQPDGIFRAVSNLVRNSLRYAGSNGPISIAAKADGEDVLLSVIDQGPGLPPDALDRVFTPFYRLDDSRSRESGGVGLGLAMVKSLVESSGGAVFCRNLEPKGLEVIIRLPRAT